MNDLIQEWFDTFSLETALKTRTIELEQMTAERDHLLKVIKDLETKYSSEDNRSE